MLKDDFYTMEFGKFKKILDWNTFKLLRIEYEQ